MIVAQGHSIGVKQYRGTDGEAELVLLALQCFGFLIKHAGPFMSLKRFSFAEFAEIIEKNYAVANPRTIETIRVLREVHARNVDQAQPA